MKPCCSVPGCERISYAKGFCNPHWQRARDGKPLDKPLQKKKEHTHCTVPGCGRKFFSAGMCAMHHQRMRQGKSLSDPVQARGLHEVCTVPECGREHYAKGLCASHYQRDRQGKDLTTPFQEKGRTGCSVPGCDLPHECGGLCGKHYKLRSYRNDPAKHRAYGHNRRARIAETGGSYTSEEWTAVLEHYGYRCRHCAKPETEEEALTVEHIVPVTKGGTSNLENLTVLCFSCNAKKNDRVCPEGLARNCVSFHIQKGKR